VPPLFTVMVAFAMPPLRFSVPALMAQVCAAVVVPVRVQAPVPALAKLAKP
jgi:hypothetical protein